MAFNPGDKVIIGAASADYDPNANPPVGKPPVAISDPKGEVVRVNAAGRVYVRHSISQAVVRWEAELVSLDPNP